MSAAAGDRIALCCCVGGGRPNLSLESRPKRGGMARLRELYTHVHMIRTQSVMKQAGVDSVLIEPVSDLGQPDSEVSIFKAELDRVHSWRISHWLSGRA